MAFEAGPKVVFIHDLEHGDFGAALANASLGAPLSLMSFTDLSPRYNAYNTGLAEAAEQADVLFLPKSGLRRRSADVMLAFAATRQSPNRVRQIIHYDDGYVVDDGYFNCFERPQLEATT